MLDNKMYERALEIARKKICGGPDHPFFKNPYLDAAFFGRLFYWDTCFIACWAKYHVNEMPLYQSLDNFYDLQDEEGFICREYSEAGEACWPKYHPVSLNPPLLAFAEWDIYGVNKDLVRLKRVYPFLHREFVYRLERFRGDEGLFYCDAFGSGMDNLPRYPDGWYDDGKGIALGPYEKNGASEITHNDIAADLSTRWNSQGRMIDINCQMIFCARNLEKIAMETDITANIPLYREFIKNQTDLINERMWDGDRAFYFDLSYGNRNGRYHIGAFWAMLAGVLPREKADVFVGHLFNKDLFAAPVMVPSLAVRDPLYDKDGEYWRGGVWPPATYMVLRGLEAYGYHREARAIGQNIYTCVQAVFDRDETFYEFYKPMSPERGYVKAFDHQAVEDFCGWSALIPIAVYKEFLDSSDKS